MAEYGMVVALIILGCIASLTSMGETVASWISGLADHLATLG